VEGTTETQITQPVPLGKLESPQVRLGIPQTLQGPILPELKLVGPIPKRVLLEKLASVGLTKVRVGPIPKLVGSPLM
jgi:hypothetical protein